MNAVEHAYPPGDGDFVVRAINVDGEVEIEVQDFGFWRPPRGNSERGRGLELTPAIDGLDQGRARSGGHHRAPPPQGTQRGVRMSPLAQLDTRTEGNAVIACVVGEVDISNASESARRWRARCPSAPSG